MKLSIFMSYHGFGGAEKNAILMANQLSHHNFDVEVVIAGQENEDIRRRLTPNVSLVFLGTPKILQSFVPLRRYLKTRRPDALQVRIWPLTVIGVLAAKLSGQKIRVICSHHTVLSISHIAQSLKSRFAICATTAIAYRLADARFGVSKGAADDMAKMALMSRKKFEVINNASSPVPENPEISDVLKQYSKGRKTILAVGTLKSVKGFDFLINSVAELTKMRDDFCVAIIGEGQERQALEAQIDDNNLGDVVKLFGFQKDVNAFYAGADLFALTSHLEGFVNVMVEALAFGLTIVSVDCPTGPREILQDGAFGTLVTDRSAEKFSQALSAGLDAPSNIETQKSRVKDFHIDKITQEYIDIVKG